MNHHPIQQVIKDSETYKTKKHGRSIIKEKKEEQSVKDFISWFEIPAINFQQSVDFYNHIFQIKMETNYEWQLCHGFFPCR